MKIFSFNSDRSGTYIDPISGAVGTNTNGEFVRSEKGMAWKGNGSNSVVLYPSKFILSGDFSIAVDFRYKYSTGHRTILGNDGGSGYLNIRDTGSVYFQTSATTTFVNWTRNELWNQLIIIKIGAIIYFYMNAILLDTFSLGSSAETFTFDEIGYRVGRWLGDIGKVETFDTALTTKERASLYNEFLQAQPTSTAISENLALPKVSDRSAEVDSVIGIRGGDFVTDLVTNGDFATDSDWGKQASWTIGSGVANYDGVTSGTYLSQSMSILAGKTAIVEITIINWSGTGSTRVSLGAGTPYYSAGANGTFSFLLTAESDNPSLLFRGFDTHSFDLDNVSLKEWDGEELVPDDDVGYVANDVAEWDVFGTNTITQDGNAVKTTYTAIGGSAFGSYVYLRNTTDQTLFNDQVIGQKYRLSFRAKINLGSADIQVYQGSVKGSQTISNTEYAEYYIDYIASDATNMLINMGGLSVGEIVWIELLSLKKVSGLIASYNMIPSADGVLCDTSGEGNVGAIVGAVSSDRGMVFNKEGQYVQLTADIDLEGEATICLKGIRSAEAGSYLLSHATIGTRLLHFSTNAIKFYNKGSEDEIVATSGIASGDSFDLVISINGNISNTYINGVFSKTTTFASSLDAVVRQIGTSIALNRGAFDELEDCSIHSRAWTEQECQQYHQSFEKVEHSGLIEDFSEGDTI